MSATIDHYRPDGMTACHECDALHRLRALPPGGRAFCTRCGAALYREPRGGVDTPLAWSLAALGLFVLANVFPFITLKLEGRLEENLIISGVLAMWREGMPELALLVFLTAVLFPLLMVSALLWLLVPVRLGFRAPATAAVHRLVQAIAPWTLPGVFMLGALIAFVKLLDIATVIPGVSMMALTGLIVAATAAASSFDTVLLWPRIGPPTPSGEHYPRPPVLTAQDLALVGCHTCTLLVPRTTDACPRCGDPVHESRKTDSLARTWALVVSALLLLVPANVYPVMTLIRFGQGEPSTILGGVVHLIESGMWGLALIVFVASVAIPALKLGLLVYLLLSVQRGSAARPRDRTRLYRLTEAVGAWSMVDIFLVAILSALVNLQALATIRPGVGASFFAAVVVITMFAAHSFDSRLIWDNARRRA